MPQLEQEKNKSNLVKLNALTLDLTGRLDSIAARGGLDRRNRNPGNPFIFGHIIRPEGLAQLNAWCEGVYYCDTYQLRLSFVQSSAELFTTVVYISGQNTIFDLSIDADGQPKFLDSLGIRGQEKVPHDRRLGTELRTTKVIRQTRPYKGGVSDLATLLKLLKKVV